jgi:hypothetical protein
VNGVNSYRVFFNKWLLFWNCNIANATSQILPYFDTLASSMMTG